MNPLQPHIAVQREALGLFSRGVDVAARDWTDVRRGEMTDRHFAPLVDTGESIIDALETCDEALREALRVLYQ